MDPVKIPQNVHVEDRIIGPVSLRQLIIVMIGGAISYTIWSGIKMANGGAASVTATVLSWIPCAIAAIFAFVTINHVSMFKLCLLLIERADKAPVRVWSPRTGISIDIQTYKHMHQIEENKTKTPEKKVPQSDWDTLSSVLDVKSTENQPTENTSLPLQLPSEISQINKPEAKTRQSDNFVTDIYPDK